MLQSTTSMRQAQMKRAISEGRHDRARRKASKEGTMDADACHESSCNYVRKAQSLEESAADRTEDRGKYDPQTGAEGKFGR